LLRLGEDMIGVQISAEPDKDNDRKQDKARPVFHGCKKGQQKNPKDNVISYPDQGEGMRTSLFDRLIVSRVLAKPREPHGCMLFDNYSVQHPNHHQPNQTTPC